jgi:hypothetical protein
VHREVSSSCRERQKEPLACGQDLPVGILDKTDDGKALAQISCQHCVGIEVSKFALRNDQSTTYLNFPIQRF